MKQLIQLVIRLADLAEAEGRAAKRHAVHAVVLVFMFAGAGVLALAGTGAILLGIWEGLILAGTPGWVSTLLVGLLLLLLACAIFAAARISSARGPK